MLLKFYGGEVWTGGFCKQGISNANIIKKTDGSFLIYLTGDDSLDETKLIDAIFLVERMPNGNYKLMPGTCTQRSEPILRFEDDPDTRPFPLDNLAFKNQYI